MMEEQKDNLKATRLFARERRAYHLAHLEQGPPDYASAEMYNDYHRKKQMQAASVEQWLSNELKLLGSPP